MEVGSGLSAVTFRGTYAPPEMLFEVLIRLPTDLTWPVRVDGKPPRLKPSPRLGEHSAGPMLTVPEAAVFARADGRIYLTKVTGARSEVQVPVRVVVTGDGEVGVAPVGSGRLAAGDRVVTGINYAQTQRVNP